MANQFKSGLQTQNNEICVENLPVTGKLPDWLCGTLIRNTPAQFEVNGKSFRHWFDGLAMLHAFTIEGGKVAYRNRFIQSPAYKDNNTAGKITYNEFATDPCRSLFSRIFSHFSPPEFGANTNVNVTRLGDEYLALTEMPIPIEFDPHTLETLNIHEYDGIDGQISTAHPHFDGKYAYNYVLRFGKESYYVFYRMQGRKVQQMAQIPVSQPSYIHSFAMTEHYLILAEFALKLPHVLSLLLFQKPFIEHFRWMPRKGARFIIVDKNTGEIVKIAETDAFFSFHHVNAYEQGRDIVLDMVCYEDASIVSDFYLKRLRDETARISMGQLRRYCIALDSGKVSHENISDMTFELPRIDYPRVSGKPYRYTYGAADKHSFFDQLLKVDVQTGAVKTWHETHCYPGEPVFIPSPDAKAEDDGLILSVVLHSQRQNSFMLVLDAVSFAEVARVEVPQVIPFGFHGEFFTP